MHTVILNGLYETPLSNVRVSTMSPCEVLAQTLTSSLLQHCSVSLTSGVAQVPGQCKLTSILYEPHSVLILRLYHPLEILPTRILLPRLLVSISRRFSQASCLQTVASKSTISTSRGPFPLTTLILSTFETC